MAGSDMSNYEKHFDRCVYGFKQIHSLLKTKYPMSDELKITKQRVLAAAERCSDAKNVLKELFPEVFEDGKYLDLSKLPMDIATTANGTVLLQRRSSLGSEYSGKSFYLNSQYDWKIVEDINGALCLIPTRK